MLGIRRETRWTLADARTVGLIHGANDLYGSSKVLLQDVKLLAEAGRRVRVVLPYDGPLTDPLRTSGAEVAVVEDLRVLRRTAVRRIRVPLTLPRALKGSEAVVLSTLALTSYVPALWLRRLPMVISVHELLMDPAGRALARVAAAAGAHLVANSWATRAWLVRHGADPDSVSVAYPIASQLPEAKPRNPSGRLRVLVAGRVNGTKGHLEAIRAVGHVRQRGIDTELTLLGAPFPGQEPHLEALREEASGRPWVRYEGEVGDIRPWLESHDVLVIASTRPESFGLVALEAWSAGTHVIAPREGGAAEAAELVGGLTFGPRDIESMARAIQRFATEPHYSRPPAADAPASVWCTEERRRRMWATLLGSPLGPAGPAT